MDAHDTQPTPPLSRIDSFILHARPPMVRSPPLDSLLFFGSPGSSPSLDLRLPPLVPFKHGEPSRSTPPGEKHAKLHTQRLPPTLPFLSTASTSPFRGHLKKMPTMRAAPAAAMLRNESPDSVTDLLQQRHTCAAARGLAHGSARSKVLSAILSRGWGTRASPGRKGWPGALAGAVVWARLSAGAGEISESALSWTDDNIRTRAPVFKPTRLRSVYY